MWSKKNRISCCSFQIPFCTGSSRASCLESRLIIQEAILTNHGLLPLFRSLFLALHYIRGKFAFQMENMEHTDGAESRNKLERSSKVSRLHGLKKKGKPYSSTLISRQARRIACAIGITATFAQFRVVFFRVEAKFLQNSRLEKDCQLRARDWLFLFYPSMPETQKANIP